MKFSNKITTISTIMEKCRVCYSCIRGCPAKAIRITEGQAEVVRDRCINCGNCVQVCGQNAKNVFSFGDSVKEILSSPKYKVAVIIAPSFPAEFIGVPASKVVGMLRALGFDSVHEVGFGADLVAKAYKELLDNNPDKSYISTTCPAIVSYVEKYHAELLPNLTPIASPMVAMSRVLKKKYGPELKVVFLGPCNAKKSEAARKHFVNDVDFVLTFIELKSLLKDKKIFFDEVDSSDFDPPYANKGRLLPVGRGLLEAAEIKEGLLEENVVNADGQNNFMEALKEFSRGYLNVKLIETLSCEGCIMGAGISNNAPFYKRRHEVSQYARECLQYFNKEKWEEEIREYSDIDLDCIFYNDSQTQQKAGEKEIRKNLLSMGKNDSSDELNCGACGYETCRDHAMANIGGYAEPQMCLPYSIDRLKASVFDLEKSYSELKSVREALDHREKLASMGQLSAGIAHEVNNPLGVVLMYAHLLLERENIDEGIRKDLDMIVAQANRCKKIVSGLLNFSRQNKVIKEPVNFYDLGRQCVASLPIPSSIKVEFVKNVNNLIAEVDRDQISQVLVNLLNNAIDAMGDKGGTLSFKIEGNEYSIILIIEDTGGGVPEKYRNRIFDPFFTTKQIGKGTGLGLPVSYGIVKMHSGDIKLISNADPNEGPTGTSIRVRLPRT